MRAPDARPVFVADIGGTNTRCALVDAQGAISRRDHFATLVDDAEGQVERLVSLFRSRAEELDVHPQAGLAVPNGVAARGTVEHAPNLRWPPVFPLAERFVDSFRGRPTPIPATPPLVMNDADAAAWGEGLLGAARGLEHFVVLTLGTGLGSGLVVNGRLVEGAHGRGGEFGHVRTANGIRRCACGRTGCLETEVSAAALVRNASEALETNRAPGPLRAELAARGGKLDGEAVFRAAEGRDARATEAFRKLGEPLGRALADLHALLDLQAVVIGGGLSAAGDVLLAPVRESYARYARPGEAAELVLVTSALPPGDAALVGVARRVRELQGAERPAV